MLIKVLINIVISGLLAWVLGKYLAPMAHSDILSTAGVLSTVAGICLVLYWPLFPSSVLQVQVLMELFCFKTKQDFT